MQNMSIEKKYTDYITVVSGLPRSGTSMLMKILEAGGMPIFADHVRKPDPDNPGGYYEYEPVKKMNTQDTGWLTDCNGMAIKIVSPLLEYLHEGLEYRIIFIKRDLEEILASQNKMMLRSGQKKPETSNQEMKLVFNHHLQHIEKWLKMHEGNMSVLYVRYCDFIRDSELSTRKVNTFLDDRLDQKKMAGVVDPALYRQCIAKNNDMV